MADDIEIKGGKIFGGWRAPENLARASTTSIHDDDVAKSVGFILSFNSSSSLQYGHFGN
ncbi:unnamed protein product [marine sediment metagenome]|uniref:Uncharacterized protein n=1 Tax=marine sediment metagenome TaxID=412755 RepID=X0ZJ00_9ZZZZ